MTQRHEQLNEMRSAEDVYKKYQRVCATSALPLVPNSTRFCCVTTSSVPSVAVAVAVVCASLLLCCLTMCCCPAELCAR